MKKNFKYFTIIWIAIFVIFNFLSLIRSGKEKTLIPAYKDMDPYDLPEEFSHLQAQDMSKLGFMQDLIYGIKKVVEKADEKFAKSNDRLKINQSTSLVDKQGVSRNNADETTAPLIRRAYMFCEDGEFNRANEYAEKVLDINPECADAYIVKLLVDYKVTKLALLSKVRKIIDNNSNYLKIIRFADNTTREKLIVCRKEIIYNIACERLLKLKNKGRIISNEQENELTSLFDSIKGYKDSERKIEEVKSLCYPKEGDSEVVNSKRIELFSLFVTIFLILLVIVIFVNIY